jgi:hypothetical protein
MKKLMSQFLVALVIISFFVWIFIFSTTKPRILVLQSVSQQTDWAVRIDKGMQEVLRDNRLPVTVLFHYMNLDDQGTETHVRTAIASAKRAIEKEKPDILISVDDESNRLVTSQLNAATRPATIYLAILEPPENYGYTEKIRVTGIEENIPHQAIIDLVEDLKPGMSLRIAVVGVDDITGRAELNRINLTDWGKHTLGSVKLAKTFEQWRSFVQTQASSADLLLVLSADMLEGSEPGVFIPEKEVVEWTEAKAKPLPVGIRETYVKYGGGLAVSAPPYVYGKLAMQMALNWLDKGLDSLPSPLIRLPYFNVSIRLAALNKRSIDPPQTYQELARATGGLLP